ncbi:hypothetical protein KKI24_20640, partial [bacterium]|nr:hypothetical protein [bacterium]
MKLQTCVEPRGHFRWGLHQPQFHVVNLRKEDGIGSLGSMPGENPVLNQANFPPGAVHESKADWIYEIPNAFPFRGTTYICKNWADAKVTNPAAIHLPERPAVSFRQTMGQWFSDMTGSKDDMQHMIHSLPDPLRIALASSSSDPDDLVCLATFCCEFDYDITGRQPVGLKFRRNSRGTIAACIKDHDLFETLVNNQFLPDVFKEVMVLRPGVQGKSEIVGDWWSRQDGSHVFEYLRRNSYIPWGHYAANMANDAVRYRVSDLSLSDITGLRHLYYQRTYARLAQQAGMKIPAERRALSVLELETLREKILGQISGKGGGEALKFNRTLWGWNFGFDFAPSHYRLHASHQQIHQQFSLIPAVVSAQTGDSAAEQSGSTLSAYGCGDLIADFIRHYRAETGCFFFESYIRAIRSNRRMDEKDGSASLIIHEDSEVMLFVPKAQTSQWEI